MSPYDEADDEQLLESCRGSFEQTRRTFEVLYERHHLALFNFLRRYVGSDHAAEDLLQETFLRAFRGMDGFRPERRLADWLFTIALNAARDLRRRRRPAGEPGDSASPDAGPEEATERREEHERLSRLLLDLPEEERAVFLLSKVEGRPLQEVADLLGFSLRTAKNRLAAALDSLSRRMNAAEAP